MDQYFIQGIHRKTGEPFAAWFIADSPKHITESFDLSGIFIHKIEQYPNKNEAHCLIATHTVMSKV